MFHDPVSLIKILTDTIRVWDFNDGPPGDDPDNYRAYPPFHAPTFLSTHLEKIRSLEIIPSGTRNVRDLWDKHYDEEVSIFSTPALCHLSYIYFLITGGLVS